ncbi:DUF6263 family protein [Mucilaginibacter sp. 3215]|uniref:DUF6263 family protein n=2 Tax=unclassified Mucilaginibacter TaxID=2617802 RepID=UPI003D217011
MKTHLFNIKTALMALLLFAACFSKAQRRELTFKQGDEYNKTTYISAASILQRGKQTFNINTTSSISKSYKVTGITRSGFVLTVTTSHIDDTMDAFGKKMEYSSDRPADTSSYIQMALQSLIGKSVTLSIDKNGIITDVNDPDERYATDTLLLFAGFKQDQFITGTRLNLVADNSEALKTDASWVSNISSGNEKINTTYTVNQSTQPDKYTNLMLTSTSSAPEQNSNTNGVLVVDNASGVVLVSTVKTATLSYKFVNDATYSFGRRTEVVENCIKMN